MIRYSVCALLVFTAGFLLFHGREAAHSGSWDYTITHDDEYIYWAIARGSMAAPASDANPFYHEERNLTNPIPSYLTVTAAGRLAAVLDIQVLALLPLWKIPLPFSLWVVFFSAWFACGTIPWELAPPWRCSCCSARSLCTAPRSLPYFASRARVMV